MWAQLCRSRGAPSHSLNNVDITRSVVGHVGGDAAQNPADALHPTVTDHDEVSTNVFGDGHQSFGRFAVRQPAVNVGDNAAERLGYLSRDGFGVRLQPHVADV